MKIYVVVSCYKKDSVVRTFSRKKDAEKLKKLMLKLIKDVKIFTTELNETED